MVCVHTQIELDNELQSHLNFYVSFTTLGT